MQFVAIDDNNDDNDDDDDDICSLGPPTVVCFGRILLERLGMILFGFELTTTEILLCELLFDDIVRVLLLC